MLKNLLLPIFNFSILYRFALFDIKRRYSDTKLGLFWPLFSAVFSCVVLGGIFLAGFRIAGMKIPDNFLESMLVGYLTWCAISTSCIVSSSIIPSNPGLIKQIAFNKFLLPHSVALSNVFIFCTPIFLVLFFHYKDFFDFLSSVAQLVTSLFVLYFMVAGLTCLCSAVGAKNKDLQHLISSVAGIGAYLLPIFIPNWRDIDYLKQVVTYNPFTPIVQSIQTSILGDMTAWMGASFIAFLYSAVIYLFGSYVFYARKNNFGDE